MPHCCLCVSFLHLHFSSRMSVNRQKIQKRARVAGSIESYKQHWAPWSWLFAAIIHVVAIWNLADERKEKYVVWFRMKRFRTRTYRMQLQILSIISIAISFSAFSIAEQHGNNMCTENRAICWNYVCRRIYQKTRKKKQKNVLKKAVWNVESITTTTRTAHNKSANNAFSVHSYKAKAFALNWATIVSK